MHLTTRNAAARLGVSESTVKRMCDEGILGSIRTSGGHRRILSESLEQWIESQRVAAAAAFQPGPEGELTPQWVADCLLAGKVDDLVPPLRQQVEDHQSSVGVLDGLIAPALWTVGSLWRTGRIDVYQEHLATRNAQEVIQRIRVPSRNWIRRDSEPKAIGGVPPSEHHDVASSMIEIVLREQGWDARSLGQDLPTESFVAAVANEQPDLVWLSSTIEQDTEATIGWAKQIRSTLKSHQRMVVGGQGMTPAIRRAIEFEFAGDSLAHLAKFASGFRQEWIDRETEFSN
ncbi:MAG: helix-turn-helix domain-containing protein [Planctomycetota bacterium]